MGCVIYSLLVCGSDLCREFACESQDSLFSSWGGGACWGFMLVISEKGEEYAKGVRKIRSQFAGKNVEFY